MGSKGLGDMFTAVGPGNWAALRRTAVSGTAGDVSTLIEYGADVCLRTRGVDWRPFRHTTVADNTSTIIELAKKQDARGWSPFRIDAYCGTTSTLATRTNISNRLPGTRLNQELCNLKIGTLDSVLNEGSVFAQKQVTRK